MSSTNLAQTRICAQSFTPKTEKKLQNLCKNHCNMNQQKLRAAFMLSKLWPKGSKIRIGFIGDGSGTPRTSMEQLKTNSNFNPDPLQKIADTLTPIELFKKVVNERFVPLVNLDIKFVDNLIDANIRVSFDPNAGSWSYVGTENLDIKHPEATMNFGWIDVGCYIHEMSHCLSQLHEQSNPRGNPIQWNKELVFKWAAETQGWDKQTTQTNILDMYDVTSINGSSFDPLSVMLYFFPDWITLNKQGTRANLRLSGPDVFWLYHNYPRSDITPAEYYQKIYGENIEDAVKQSEQEAKRQGSRPFATNLIIAILVGLLVLGGIFVMRSRRK
jgi:hypothetical protein